MASKKSSFCSGADCVGVERTDLGFIRVSDTANDDSLIFTAEEWDAFIAGVKAGEFDLDALS